MTVVQFWSLVSVIVALGALLLARKLWQWARGQVAEGRRRTAAAALEGAATRLDDGDELLGIGGVPTGRFARLPGV